ncbi:MAG: hypothetical protein H7A01_01760 [Hahellaceae bacterium]|nr:hypothetical protein [Hahellaceae bacterium]MCP5212630.1 hypothetical protein [Hahellaceae bacterium]
MKSLSKIVLVTAIAAASSAQAELLAMDDSAMSATTGQAGLSIEINAAEISIGAVDYQDKGFISMKDIHFGGGLAAFGGPGDGIFNDVLITVDVVGASADDLGQKYMGEEYISRAAALVVGGGQVSGNYVDPGINDGDLVIAINAPDLSKMLQSVDYGLRIGSIGLGKSTETPGAVTDGTLLLQNLDMAGYFGPTEIIIDGNSNQMNISMYFNAEGSLDMPFMAVTTDFAIHNSRGTDQVWLGTQDKGNSMAHVQLNIGEGTASSGASALAVDVQNFEADIDLVNLTLGSAPAIGSLYITDFRLTANTVIYGH